MTARKNPAIEAAKLQRQRDRRAIALVRSCQEGREPIVLDVSVASRLAVLASRILAARCERTGEDPSAVLAAMESAI